MMFRFISLAGDRYTDIHVMHNDTLNLLEAVHAKDELADKLMRDLGREKVILDERTTVCCLFVI